MGDRLAHGLEQWFLVLGARELKTTEKLAETWTRDLKNKFQCYKASQSGVDKGIMEEEDSHSLWKGILIRAWGKFWMTLSMWWSYSTAHKPHLLGLKAEGQLRALQANKAWWLSALA